jgi:predicted dehydrogenase
MNEASNSSMSRRDFGKMAGAVTAATALTQLVVPAVHAAASNEIQIALIGCGGRGSGAAKNALSVENRGPIKLVAMADVFENRLSRSHTTLKNEFNKRVDVPDDRKFIGFDAYKKAMDCLKSGDIAIFATPPAFRWVHFTYAVEKGLNVFMEKPVTVDGPTTKKMLKLAEESEKKNLKVGVGLMVRHCRGRRELWNRIRNGEMGDIVTMRAYRMSPASALARPKPPEMSELLYQIRSFHGFLWASGGCYSDYYIHQIDECSWMKDSWPIMARALGGRHYRENTLDQNLDTYGVEYTYPDGARLFYNGRNMNGCYTEFASYAHGTKGSCIITTSGHVPGQVRIFKGQNQVKSDLAWAFPQPEPSTPYQDEWNDLVDAVQKNEPYNEVKRGAMASLVTSMGRMAAHTGQIITLDQMMECPHEFAPDADKFTMDSPAPLQLGADGKYPVPSPGIKKDREY